MTNTQTLDRIAVIRDEARRFADVLATADPEARCPTCPDWNAADLLWHLTEVHSFWATVLGDDVRTDERAQALEERESDRPETIAAMLPMRARATDALVEQLAALGDAEPRWSWWEADQTVGFTRRMQTCEATIHRVDAELTAGQPVSPIAPELAAACVDHCVDVMWGWMPPWATYRTNAVVRLDAADTGQRWLVDVGRWTGTGPESGKQFDEIRATRAQPESEPTARVVAPVADLALWAWTRGGEVDVTGNPGAVAAVNALIANGIQ